LQENFTYKDLEDYDNSVWYYDYENNHNWKIWETDNLIERYKKIIQQKILKSILEINNINKNKFINFICSLVF
jgi:hypothetical protein